MKIAFFGSDYYSTIVLKEILKDTNHEVTAVVTGSRDPEFPFKYDTITDICTKHQIQLLRINQRNDFKLIEPQLIPLKPEIGLSASFGFLIPENIFSIPTFGIINIHPSLLPMYRGVTPLQHTILDGLTETGVTLIKINDQFDTGSIIIQEKVKIESDETTFTLGNKLFTLGSKLFLQVLSKYPNGNFPIIEQDLTLGNYVKKIDESAGLLDFTDSGEINFRKIRAFYPKPIAWCFLSDLVKKYSANPNLSPKWQKVRVQIFEAEMINNQLFPKTLQIEGKSKITWQQFKSGYLQ